MVCDYIGMQPLDWLIVAPRHIDLDNVPSELAAISSHHNIVPDPPLEGYVTSMDIAHAVARTRCDVFSWSTHQANGALQLSDGHTLDADTAAEYVRASSARLCIFNVCLGRQFEERVAYLCDCDVIYSPVAVDDEVAATYMAQLAAALVEYDDFYEAYQAVGSHGGEYKYIRAKDSVTRGRVDNAAIIDGLRIENQQIKASIVTFTMFMIVAAALVFWVGWSLNAYREEISALRIQMAELRTELHYIQLQIERGQ